MASPEPSFRPLESLANALASRGSVARRLDLIARENTQRLSGAVAGGWRRPARIAVTLAIAAGLMWFFGLRLGHYFNRQNGIDHDPRVWNLTKAGVRWDVFYGHSALCADGKECLLLPDTPSTAFQKQMVLPAREFPLESYHQGDIIYLRTTVTLPPQVRDLKEPISFQSLYVWAEHYTFYVNGVALEQGANELLNITLPDQIVKRDQPLHLAFRIDPGKLPYQGLAHRADLFIGAKSVLKQTVYDAFDVGSVYYLWFILPKLTFSLVFALLFLALNRHAELFAFIVYAGLSTLDAFLHSQYTKEMLPPLLNWQLLGTVTRCFVALAFMRFVHDFYRRQSAPFLVFQKWAVAVLAVYGAVTLWVLPEKLASDMAVCVSEALRLVSYGYANYMSALMLVYLTVTRLSVFRQRVALVLTLFCVVILVVGSIESTFQVLEVFGVAYHEATYRLTWICDLFLFLVLSGVSAVEFGLTASARELTQARIEAIEGRLELALTVQRLLLPRNLSASSEAYSYRFVHEPAEQMSGDWINIWHDEASDEVRLLFGDVVGKGPQAALAVSAIAGLLSDARTRGLDMEQCLQHVNDHLRHLFHGHIYSTLAAIVLRADRRTDLYCCGSAGWIITSPAGTKLLPLRSAPLGVNPVARIGRATVELGPATWALSFTDGCLEGPRSMKRLLEQLKDLARMDALGGDAILSSLFVVGSEDVKVDDRTAVVVSGSRWAAAAAADGAAAPVPVAGTSYSSSPSAAVSASLAKSAAPPKETPGDKIASVVPLKLPRRDRGRGE